MLKPKQLSSMGICVLLILSITSSLFILLSPKAHAWSAGEKPTMCPVGTWDTWKTDWESMATVDYTPGIPPSIKRSYLVIQATDGYPWNTIQTAYVWNESIRATTVGETSALHFPNDSGGGYMLNRFTDDHTIDTSIDSLNWLGDPLTLFDGRYTLCIVAASGIVSHSDYPYVGTDTSWFNYSPPVDSVVPTASSPSISRQLILFRGNVTFSAKTVDAQSAIRGGEYYFDVDPGKGKGTPMTFKDGKITGSALISKLRLGKHTLYMRSVDVAGNWSKPVSKQFIYIGFSR